MRITKFGHACVRVEHDGATVVIDPGMFTDAEAVDGVDAVLVTHQHLDHWDGDLLRSSNAPVYTIADVREAIAADAPDLVERVTVVQPGEEFEVAGIPVHAVGELHAVIHPEFDRVHNSGYLLHCGEQRVYHPGDSLEAPGVPIDVLCAPASAPWLKASEAVDFVRQVEAPINLSIHDRIYTEAAHDILEHHMNYFLKPAGQQWVRLDDGTDL
jgi:L-ascorbate metabolism protein UlaG (beta-lactamase superfamily)